MAAVDPVIAEKHAVVRNAGGFMPSRRRGVIEVRGGDRLEWLHNLVTNTVRTLATGDGNYAFATSAQGRVLFDLNLLVLDEVVWLDIDRRWIADAMVHLEKYHVTEDVALEDISAAWARITVLGPATANVIETLGLGRNFTALPDVQYADGRVDGIAVRMVKDNIGPIPRADLIVPANAADELGSALENRAAAAGIIRINDALFDMIRIEAGRPASVDDIDDQVIPPESLQVERGISYVKGCYIGQEVIERMRSRGVMARHLVGFRVEGDRLPPHNARVFGGDKEIGRITSSCHSVALDGVLGLGYLKTALAQSTTQLEAIFDDETRVPVARIDLPLPMWM